jgi:hypothetical protein
MSDPDKLCLGAAQNLTRSAKAGRVFETAHVKIVGLADNPASARFGSMNVLQAALNEYDIVISCGDGFLVIYDQPDARDLEAETETLQQVLNVFYAVDPGLRATVARQTMSSRDVVRVLAGDTPGSPAPEALIRFAPVNRQEGARAVNRPQMDLLAKTA